MPYYLNNNASIPEEGEDLMQHLMKKYGPAAVQRFGQPGNPLDMAGSKVGITFNKDRKVLPTKKPHQIVEWTMATEGPKKVDELMEVLFRRYFVEGEAVNQHEVLLDAVEEAGLDRSKAEEVLQSSTYVDVVAAKDNTAKTRLRCNGVPFFVISGESASGSAVSFSGAQPAEVIEEAIREVEE